MDADENKMNPFTILQFSDSAFPTGGFSHSLGFESSLQRSLISNKKDFEKFIIGCLENAGTFSLAFVKAAYKNSNNLDKLSSLEEIYQASLYNHVANRASLQQGRSLVNTANITFGLEEIQTLQNAISDILQGHHAIILGALCAYLHITCQQTMELFMFGLLRTVIASAIRLGHFGPLEGQKMQYQLQQLLPDIINRNLNTSVEDSTTSFPLSDIVQNTHDTLFSKLFYS